MHFSKINGCDAANGSGFRVTLFVSGCRHNCKGCFNTKTHNFKFGRHFEEKDLNHIIELLDKPWIKGLTLLGGEPLEPENQAEVFNIISKVKEKFNDSKDIWCFTGAVFEDLIDKSSRYSTDFTIKILENIDILVDGPFILDKRDILHYPFRGSSNQRLLDCKRSIIEGKPVLYEL